MTLTGDPMRAEDDRADCSRGLLVALYMLAPFSWLVLTSFMHEHDALSVPPQWIPQRPHARELHDLLRSDRHARRSSARAPPSRRCPGMLNSLIAALGTAVLNLVLGTLAGYSLARYDFRGRSTLLAALSRLAHAARASR